MKEYDERGRRIWYAEGNQDKIRTIPTDPEEVAKNQIEIRARWEAELAEEQELLAKAPVEEMDFHLRNVATIQERLETLSGAEEANNLRRERNATNAEIDAQIAEQRNRLREPGAKNLSEVVAEIRRLESLKLKEAA